MAICLDTTILIDVLRGDPKAKEYVEQHQDEIVTTDINVFELFAGTRTGEERTAVEAIIERLPILPLSTELAKEAGLVLSKLLKEGKRIDFRDVLIGVIAREHGASLKTDNAKHFARIPKLHIE